jgi:hypothetical protein
MSIIPVTYDNRITRTSSTNSVSVHNHFHNNNIDFAQVYQNIMTDSNNTGNTSSVAAGDDVAAGNDVAPGNTLTSGCAELDAMFDAAGRQYNINPNLLRAVAQVESNFRANATSPAGAMGIMQIMPATARHLGVTDPFDPLQSIMGGARYLREQLDRFNGDIRLALAAYNAGWPTVQRHGGIPPFPQTQAYVARVMELFGDGDVTAGMPAQANTETPGLDSNNYCPTCATQLPPQTDTSNTVNMNELLQQMAMMMMMNMQMGLGGSGNRNSFF